MSIRFLQRKPDDEGKKNAHERHEPVKEEKDEYEQQKESVLLKECAHGTHRVRQHGKQEMGAVKRRNGKEVEQRKEQVYRNNGSQEIRDSRGQGRERKKAEQ